MITLPPVLAYVALCAVVGYWGRNWNIGFAGCFVLSLLLTPLLVGVFVLISAPRTET
ncbi:hypothetical protein [uncultured Tateyamaria sp.]|uniref:hypothetical protein n=1 Tax=uncultured Tateyamaria sp. TaxID=455651 RepID=UPI00260F710E|nr:hypothetical protein [uncultured Tateyamaria sp.]